MADILETRLHAPHTTAGPCPRCQTPLEFITSQASSSSSFASRIRCFSCGNVFPYVDHEREQREYQARQKEKQEQQARHPSAARKGRKIGTQERPLETAYYDLLGVPVDASADDIKKAYRRLAIKNHPDKGGSEELFKEIAIAYQVLSDPELRRKYNEFGPREGAQPDGGFVDPEEVFSTIFGGERFVPIIGDISLGKDMKEALQEADEAEEVEGGPKKVKDAKGKEILSPEEKAKKEEKERKAAAERAKAREARVHSLTEILIRKLSIFTESATGHPNPTVDADVISSWRQICQLEAEDLKNESYGVELLRAVGFTYVAKAKAFMASRETFLGVGGWFHGVKGTYHTFTETVSTVRSALELKQVFDQIAEAEKSGASPEEKKKLEEQAAEKGLQALFKGAKLEIESVIRETCDRVLSPQLATPSGSSPLAGESSSAVTGSISREKLALRAKALLILGEAYCAVKKDGEASEEAEYVRVETKASKEREREKGSR